jgi:crotonobetainyl-CoA:carnitine CoA-transferase CaiB-like acyl-CoA transferase
MAARHSTTHMSINRHKRSMTLNLRCDTGCEVFYKILPSIDTFVDGFACERLGMSYEASERPRPTSSIARPMNLAPRGPYGQIPFWPGPRRPTSPQTLRADGRYSV